MKALAIPNPMRAIPKLESGAFGAARSFAGPLLLVAAISLGYAAEMLFQPDVFANFSPRAIASAMTGVFLEGLIVGVAMVLAVAWVERRSPRRAWIYTVQMLAAVTAASFVGVTIWAVIAIEGRPSEVGPYLTGEALRLAVLGAFIALVHGLGRRLRAAREVRRQTALETASLQAETELAGLRLLEAQIEPHFLFNTIANVRRTWRIDPSLGARMHDNTIRYLEASLPRLRATAASLRDEVAVTRAYLELFGLRMGSRLSFTIDVPAQLGDFAFPRMALLTLVENAIKHGLMPSEEGGSIAVVARDEGESISVSVIDDGVGFGVADTGGTGIGLKNIRARLLSEYGRAASLEIGSTTEERGVIAVIRVPRRPTAPADTGPAPMPSSMPLTRQQP